MTPDLQAIKPVASYLPHRYPFLLIDSIESVQPPSILCKKLVSHQEPALQGHFPAYPVFPGVLMVEASAQASGILMHFIDSVDLMKNKLGLFAGIDSIKFKKAVFPGDTLWIRSEYITRKMGIFFFKAEIKVNELVVMEGSIRIALTPAPQGWLNQ